MHYHHDTSVSGDPSVRDIIRIRAFQIYEARGCAPDHALDDWLKAEHEIRHHLGLESQDDESSRPIEQHVYPTMLLVPTDGEVPSASHRLESRGTSKAKRNGRVGSSAQRRSHVPRT